MIIRDATAQDLSSIVRLNIDEYWDNHGEWEKATTYERWQVALWWGDIELLRWYYSVLTKADGGILIAVDNGKVVGQLDYVHSFDHIVDFKGIRCHIIWVLIDRAVRREGIAQSLVDGLQDQVSVPIWVEPEDERSEGLYEKLGQKIFSISNWSLSYTSLSEPSFNLIDTTAVYQMTQLLELDEQFKLLVGRYYAPSYDLYQLISSEPVADLMWGNTDYPAVNYYQTGVTHVYAIMTQYPRLWVNEGYDATQLSDIIATISLQLFEQGFDMIYLQVYNESGINPVLDDLGFQLDIVSDPVYKINP